MEARSSTASARLILHYGSQRVALDAAGNHEYTLGKEADNDLQILRDWVSRYHVSFKVDHQYFVLVDHSTNGTYVQTEDERVTHVHRHDLRLWGDGYFSLGEPLDKASAIRFEHH